MIFGNKTIFLNDATLEIPLTTVDVKLSANDLLGIINGMKFEDKMELIVELFCWQDGDRMEEVMLKQFKEWKK